MGLNKALGPGYRTWISGKRMLVPVMNMMIDFGSDEASSVVACLKGLSAPKRRSVMSTIHDTPRSTPLWCTA